MTSFRILPRLVLSATVALLSFTALHTQAQGVGTLFTVSTPFRIDAISTSNLPPSLAREVVIGGQGVGVFIRTGGTNATTTTNATITFEMTVDGVNWISNVNPVVSVPCNGTLPLNSFTNILLTSPNLGNTVRWRIRSIQNTNTTAIWFTNYVYRTK